MVPMFTDYSILLREICNGIMCVSAVVLVGIFTDYILRRWREDSARCFKDSAVQAALAILVLLCGHAIRAFSGWMQFLWMRNDMDPDFWANAVELFLTATVLIIAGKVMMIYTFAPVQWRWKALVVTVIALAVPIVVAILV
jgi:hypothetical protein